MYLYRLYDRFGEPLHAIPEDSWEKAIDYFRDWGYGGLLWLEQIEGGYITREEEIYV